LFFKVLQYCNKIVQIHNRGASKGAVLSHSALIHQIMSMEAINGLGRPFDPTHTNLIITKGTHMTGAEVPILGIIQGKQLIMDFDFDKTL
jgi:carbamoylphosphate synthase small subunit